MQDTIENKERIYGRYEDQAEAIAHIVDALDWLRSQQRVGNEGISSVERTDYTILAMKLTRTVTATGESEIDSYVDLANYARLIARRRTGVDIATILAPVFSEVYRSQASDADGSIDDKDEEVSHGDQSDVQTRTGSKVDLTDLIVERR